MIIPIKRNKNIHACDHSLHILWIVDYLYKMLIQKMYKQHLRPFYLSAHLISQLVSAWCKYRTVSCSISGWNWEKKPEHEIMRDWKTEKNLMLYSFEGLQKNNTNPIDIVLRLKLDPQHAIVRTDNGNSGADGLKAHHQVSQLPNYICQEEVEISGTAAIWERLGVLIDLLWQRNRKKTTIYSKKSDGRFRGTAYLCSRNIYITIK